jgi:hypothetical protein
MKRKTRNVWPPRELCLPSLAELERLSRCGMVGEGRGPDPRVQLSLFQWGERGAMTAMPASVAGRAAESGQDSWSAVAAPDGERQPRSAV